jgi:hypothetical protein
MTAAHLPAGAQDELVKARRLDTVGAGPGDACEGWITARIRSTATWGRDGHASETTQGPAEA